ncbi:Pentatricopeptide repeat-containing protein [Heracleum sosnowskyi]|uniref:Pentatricopeptide repeat-containing protein n=1 Tax=Heracleum sosnowskyi TaxID=360622 RepID=A0AAD8I819_9APIA|nr:Pentatricopeptide repeat-containing protein [Heracleum sosnowskyi]
MQSYLVQVTSKLKRLARAGQIVYARKLFDEMPYRDLVAWNSMLSSYSHLGLYQDALSLFHYMRITNIRPDHFTFTSTLSACAGADELRYGHKVHALVVVLGYCQSLPVNNALIDMYGKCLSPFSAGRVFEELGLRNEVSWCSLVFAYVNADDINAAYSVLGRMPKRVDIAWNTMIAGCARLGDIKLCFSLFKDMLEDLCDPDQWTLSALMSVCGEAREFLSGCAVHAYIIKSGWALAVEASNSILSFFARLGHHDGVLKMLESVEYRTQVSWNAIIDAYMKIGDTQKAFDAFEVAPDKSIVSWTSMISGYARNGQGVEAVRFYRDMIRNGIQPNSFSLGAVLHACSILATLGHGSMVHCCSFRNGFHTTAYVGNGLVNMYAKCGDIEGSNKAFCDILVKDVVSWNTILLAYGMNGWASKALQVQEEMVASGVNPDKVTFTGLLMTCSHSGLIEKGRSLLKSMSDFGLSPDVDHVTCVVDMLGRGGYLKEAREVANLYLGKDSMKISSGEPLFGACASHCNAEMGAELGEALKSSEPENAMSYVVLSNLYCASGRWKEAEIMRKTMLDQGVIKMPGCSWIELRNEVTTFVAGCASSHPFIDEMYSTIYILEYQMKNPCAVT